MITVLERTIVYVDTSYLLASFYNSWEEGARGQLEISLSLVCSRIDAFARSHIGQPVHRQLWYDGIPDSGPHRYQRTLRVIEGVQLRAGQLIEWGERRTQKAVDTLLVADMIQAALKGYCSDMILISGDADMIPGVKVAVDAGVRMHLMGFGWDSISSALRHCCDTCTVLDPRTEFEDAMQIRVLEGPFVPRVQPSGSRPVHPGEEERHPEVEGEDGVGLRDVDLRADRAAAMTVAAERSRQSAADEERAADEEERSNLVEGHLVEETSVQGTSGAQETADTRTIPGDPAVHTGAEAAVRDSATSSPGVPGSTGAVPSSESLEEPFESEGEDGTPSRPNPSMMAPHRRPLRSKYVPLSEEVWTTSGEQTPYDVGRQYASWWYDQAASSAQRDDAHLLTGGTLPPEIDRPLLQFACQMLSEYTLDEHQRVRLRDGFHEGIRGVLLR